NKLMQEHFNEKYMESEKYANSTFSGKINETIDYTKDGTYDVTLKKNLFFDSTFTVTVPKDQKINISIDFSQNQRMLGQLFVESSPVGAKIFINDSNTNHSTPFTFNNLLPGSYTLELKSEGYKDIVYTAIIESSKKVNRKFVLVDSSIWSEYNILDHGIEAEKLTCITADHNDLIWIGSRDGLVLYDHGTWRLYNPSNSYLTHTVVHDLSVTPNNELFVATQAGFSIVVNQEPLIRYTSAGGRVAAQATGFPSDVTYGIYAENGFPFYFATEKGLGAAKEEIGNYFLDFSSETPHLFITQFLTCIYYSNSDQEIFAGTKGSGLIKANRSELLEGEFTILTRGTHAMPTNSVSDITDDKLGNIWIAFIPDVTTTISTLVSYREGAFQQFPLSTGDSRVNKIFVDSRNIKWVGTETGLFYFSDNVNNRKYLNESTTGLKLEKVNGITEDSKGNIWISTFENGLFQIKDVEKLINN
ncbi:MAG: PEGA domain-containing protein, partial [Melioribacteraceae bacterium]